MNSTVYRILCCDLFSFHTLKILPSCLLVSIVADEKAAVVVVTPPFGNLSLFTESFHFFSCFAISPGYECARGYPDIWPNLILGVSLRAFGDDT